MTASFIGYAGAGTAYALLVAILLLRRSSRQGQHILLAVAATACWGVAIAALLALSPALAPKLALIPDAARAVLWISCLLLIVPHDSSLQRAKVAATAVNVLLFGGVVIGLFLPGGERLAHFMLFALALVGCAALLQTLRNSGRDREQVARLLLWTIAFVFAFDLFVFADAFVSGVVDPNLWASRGYLAAVAVPFFVLLAKRHPDWAEVLFVSRQFVSYTAAMAVFAVYVSIAGVGAFFIEQSAGEWGTAIEAGYLVLASALLVYIFSSARLRAHARVFISKHFYRNRYDYREEWLRLIRTLTDPAAGLPLEQRSIKALCEIVGADGGQLWLDARARSVYEPFGSWCAPFPRGDISSQSSLVRFLERYSWVIDTREYRRDPERYEGALSDDTFDAQTDGLIVPLINQDALLGFMRLSGGARELNYEDHDLLKTAGRQIAAFLAHDLAREQLAETQQFEAFNKLSAFVMHDLKNLLAQQALLVNNAKKFRDRPDFVTDVIATVESSVRRMRRLLRQLEQGMVAPQGQRVDLNRLILRIVSVCSDDGGIPCTFAGSNAVWVVGPLDQLESVLMHVVQNARDATRSGGAVAVRLQETPPGTVVVEVEDTGAGMSEEFVRRRLFKPFDTTKGHTGMGIGAYQARELVRSLGGEFSVASAVGQGTIVRITLPRAGAAKDTGYDDVEAAR